MQLVFYVITVLLGVGGFMVRNELARLQAADAMLTEAITALTRALSDLKADLPREYMLRSDMLEHMRASAEEARGTRQEISQLRKEMADAVGAMRADLLSAVRDLRQERNSRAQD